MNEPLKVMLVGEGANELGDWIQDAPYRMARRTRRKAPLPVVGVLETLLRKVAPDGWTVVDALPWSSLVKLKQKTDAFGDARNLARALLRAKEQRYDVVVFSRDRDGAKNRSRQVEVDAIVTESSSTSGAVKVVGAVAVETLEAWVLAAAGDQKCESYTDPARELTDRFNVPSKDTSAMVALVEAADLSAAAARSESLQRWIGSARWVFAPATA